MHKIGVYIRTQWYTIVLSSTEQMTAILTFFLNNSLVREFIVLVSKCVNIEIDGYNMRQLGLALLNQLQYHSFILKRKYVIIFGNDC